MVQGGLDRRTMLAGALALAPLASRLEAQVAPVAPDTTDEVYWQQIAAQYDVTREVIQLENGNWGMMPRAVLAAYRENLARVNRDTSYYSRRGFAADANAVRNQLAEAMGVPADELAFTRNATEALKALILGYNRVKQGDSILYADLDYDSMQACMDSLARQHGARVMRITLPEPATRENLIEAYARAFEESPRLKLVLLTRLSHRTGLVIPVREIAAMARARGIDAIVDAAHSWYQCDADIASLDCDFVGVNCHKWLGAPLGLGAIHIRKSALDRIDLDPAEAGDHGIWSRIHTGTSDFAAILTAPAALAFHQRIGDERRMLRLRALRDRWVAQVRHIPRVEVLTPDDPTLYGAITSLRLRDITSKEGNRQLAAALLDQYGIFTVHRTGIEKGACVRVTPALFNSMKDVDALATAVTNLANSFKAT
ncbi:aminotransferase class V-fold PLP-dependent enzyme [Novosphingobium sp. RD2P27]|uniref:Aminotransferase class V-fold PLP-dependent enzyme n=1 Tax=Novosphingobium kalidii TaxID=3230299 RepID=A0ABV2CX85_9SPHN